MWLFKGGKIWYFIEEQIKIRCALKTTTMHHSKKQPCTSIRDQPAPQCMVSTQLGRDFLSFCLSTLKALGACSDLKLKYLVRHKMLILTPILLQWTYSNQACFSVKSQHLLHKFCPLSANLRLFLFLKTIFWPEAVVAALWHSYTIISARTWISTRCMVQLTSTKIGCKLRKRITISRQRKYISVSLLNYMACFCSHKLTGSP